MKLAAARGIACVVGDDELDEDYIIPSVFNRDVAREVADAPWPRWPSARRRGRRRRAADRRARPTVTLMRVAVTGATGTIGARARARAARARRRGDRRSRATPSANVAEWADPKAAPAAARRAARARRRRAPARRARSPSAGRDDAKREIRDSRVLGTRNLVAALGELPEAERPSVLVSQSGAGWYGPRGDERLDESAPGRRRLPRPGVRRLGGRGAPRPRSSACAWS